MLTIKAAEKRQKSDRDGNVSFTDFVMNFNLHRRHLTPSQLAMVALKVLPFCHKGAKGRQIEAGREYGRGHKKVQENSPEPISTSQARDEAAAMVGVSGRSVSEAKRVAEKGAPGLKEMVESGSVARSPNKAKSTEEYQWVNGCKLASYLQKPPQTASKKIPAKSNFPCRRRRKPSPLPCRDGAVR